MTQPNPSVAGDAQQERLKRGARTSLETRRHFQGTVTQASEQRVVVEFPGTEDLDRRLTEAGAGEAHLVFRIGLRADPPDVAVLVFINTPDATTATTQSLAGSVAFFEHGHPGHEAPFRLPLTAVLRQAPSQAAVTATFVPVAFPERASTPQALDLSADLHLVRSTVERE